MQYLGDVCTTRDNGFNLLRLVAAVSILVAHCTLVIPVITLEEASANPNIRFGVDILLAVFFVFSGFLITASMDRNNNILRFAVARILRVFPGLIVVSFLLAFILGPVVTTVTLSEYFSSPETWSFAPALSLYLDHGATLRGVFTNHPVSSAVNMPIWTLRYEVIIYAAFPLIYHLFLTRGQKFKATIFIVSFAAIILQHALPTVFPEFIFKKDAISNLIFFGSSFMIGTALWTFRQSIPHSINMVFISWALFAASMHLDIGILFGVMAAGYSFIWLAFANIPIMRAYNVMGDYSYGVYIIHFPVAQTIYQFNNGITPALLSIQTLSITLCLAIILWNLVEKPSINQVKTTQKTAEELLQRLRLRSA